MVCVSTLTPMPKKRVDIKNFDINYCPPWKGARSYMTSRTFGYVLTLITPHNNEPIFLSGFLKCSQTCFTIQQPTKEPNIDVVKLSLFRNDCI